MGTSDIIGEVVALEESVAYQSGSVVSRTLLKDKNGSITVFAFDEGQELSDHTVPFDALVHVLDGEVEIRISGEPYVVKKGEAILMPAHRPHAVRAVKAFKMVLAMVRSSD
jgi:quercetin dioxygenase-like cupin family protein